MWPPECKQEFPKICPGDLVVDTTWLIIELGLEIGKTNILIKFHQNRVANVALECKQDLTQHNPYSNLA